MNTHTQNWALPGLWGDFSLSGKGIHVQTTDTADDLKKAQGYMMDVELQRKREQGGGDLQVTLAPSAPPVDGHPKRSEGLTSDPTNANIPLSFRQFLSGGGILRGRHHAKRRKFQKFGCGRSHLVSPG